MLFNKIMIIYWRHSLELYHNWTKVARRDRGLSIPGMVWSNDVTGTRK